MKRMSFSILIHQFHDGHSKPGIKGSGNYCFGFFHERSPANPVVWELQFNAGMTSRQFVNVA